MVCVCVCVCVCVSVRTRLAGFAVFNRNTDENYFTFGR